MAARKKKSGSVGIMNSSQRKQLEKAGEISSKKKSSAKKKKKSSVYVWPK